MIFYSWVLNLNFDGSSLLCVDVILKMCTVCEKYVSKKASMWSVAEAPGLLLNNASSKTKKINQRINGDDIILHLNKRFSATPYLFWLWLILQKNDKYVRQDLVSVVMTTTKRLGSAG